MATHAQNIENLRNATYGEQVRGSMIELFEEDYGLVKDGVIIGTDISTESDPITGYHDGAVYINNAIWHVFKLEGTAWSDKGSIVGPQGASVIGVHDNEDGTFYLIFSNGTHSDDITTVQGETGPQGPTGATGAAGPAGRSVTSITMSGTGKSHPVTATYSDGTSQTVGVVQDGADGTGTGDMSKATYDPNDNGYVDNAGAVTDGVNSISYEGIAAKANAATSLAGYGIEDAYTDQEVDDIISDAAANTYAKNDAYYDSAFQDSDYFPFYDVSAASKRNTPWSRIKSNAKSYFDGIYGQTVVRANVTASAGAEIRIPESGTVSFINAYSNVIPMSETFGSLTTPIKCRGIAVNNGYVTITLAQAVSNVDFGVLIINN